MIKRLKTGATIYDFFIDIFVIRVKTTDTNESGGDISRYLELMKELGQGE